LRAFCPFMKVVKMNVASVSAEGRRDLVIGLHNSSKPMNSSCSIVW
jgi:predicted N-formylglutamate amidohydrolase